MTYDGREALFLGDRLLVLSTQPTSVVADLPLPGKRRRSSDEIKALHKKIKDGLFRQQRRSFDEIKALYKIWL